MDTVVELAQPAVRGLAPFSLKDAPALIERVFPAQKVGIEAQKERRAGAGQTLTALGSYWKGRKPLVLVRATVLASLLPATGELDGDLELFEMLMRMDGEGISRRKPKVTAGHVWHCTAIKADDKAAHIEAPGATGDVSDQLETDTEIDGSTASSQQARRAAAISWKRIDLSRFDEAEEDATKCGRERVREATVAPGTAEERRAIAKRAEEETAKQVRLIRDQRQAERRRIEDERRQLELRALASMPFGQQVAICERVEKVEDLRNEDDPLYRGIWERVNARLGTNAHCLPELIEQLGVARFGQLPVVGDPFTGGGSIPFEAARVGCDVVASDLNPVAAMLTWGALNIVGADEETREAIAAEQRRAAAAVDAEITRLGIEHNERGDRAKAYLYCLETVDPQTGWRVPMAPSWIISQNRRCVAKLVPVYAEKRFNIEIVEGASAGEMSQAELGTVRDGHLIYRLSAVPGGEEEEHRIAISRLRGDGEGPDLPGGGRGNRLRSWQISDVVPHEPEWVPDAPPALAGAAPGAWVGGDIWLERLYCIQWVDGEDLKSGKFRPRTFFSAPTVEDIQRENRVRELVQGNLTSWQQAGLVPDMPIEVGEKTDEPIRTRGWMYWHHLFPARHILSNAIIGKNYKGSAALSFSRCQILTISSRMNNINGTAGQGGAVKYGDVFSNQALNTFLNYGVRSTALLLSSGNVDPPSFPLFGRREISNEGVGALSRRAHLWVYDPPYADAVHYHEITEYFIAWLRKNPPPPFDQWTWDSRRPLAIQGKGDKFRADMVAAFRAMADHMPDNGLQVCMFTHTDAKVWADMAQIVWGAGLQVTAAWYVSTETTSELKQGGYVQGTVLLVLRKRRGDERAYRDELVPAIRARVEEQVRTLMGLNQRAHGRQRDENLFSRADLQMAGYAAAMEVLTGCTHIDGVDMTREALRPRAKGERGLVEEMIDLAVQTATELMTPEGIEESLWERLTATERFYLTMTETEAERPQGQLGGKLDDYQNFAKAYRADGWEDLMADKTPNKACLKGPAELRRALMTGHPFSDGTLRPTLYAINELRLATERDEDPKTAADRVLHGLRDHFGEWVRQRASVRTVAAWFGRMWARNRPAEASAARQLAGIIQTERLG
jgi:adenine-specific DNA methylase